MRRREVLGLLGGAAVWANGVHSQPAQRVRRVAVMIASAEGDAELVVRVTAIQQRLQELGWIDGRNIRIDDRWSTGEPARARAVAAELIRLAPDVDPRPMEHQLWPPCATPRKASRLFSPSSSIRWALATSKAPRDRAGILPASVRSNLKSAASLELLKAVSPNLERVAVISDPAFAGFAAVSRAIEEMAPRFRLQVTSVVFHEPTDDLERAISTLSQAPHGSLIVMPTAINNIHRDRIYGLAAQFRLPAIYSLPASGGARRVDGVRLRKR